MSKRRGGSLPRVMPTKLSTLGRLAAPGKGQPAHPLSGTGRVWLATPTHSHQLIAPFVKSLIASLDALRQAGIASGWTNHPNCGLIGMARNELAAQFLADRDASHLVFLDADIAWQAKDLLRLLSHDVDVAVGIYAYRAEYKSAAYFQPARTPSGKIARDPNTGLVETCAAGAGFLSIRRQALLRIMAERPEDKLLGLREFPPEVQQWAYNFFPQSVDEFGRMLSEDASFFQRWRSLGGKIWMDPTIKLHHYGPAPFTVDPMSLLEADEIDAAAA